MATAATTSFPKTPSHTHSGSRSSRPLTTPRSNHAIATPIVSPRIISGMRSPRNKDMNGSSPSYFGLGIGEDSIPGDAGPGPHTRQNWIDPTKSVAKASSGERSPDFELFRRQSERNISFSLGTLPQHQASQNVSTTQSPILPKGPSFAQRESMKGIDNMKPTEGFFTPGIQRQDSPASMQQQPTASAQDVRNMRLSLPAHEIQGAIEGLQQAQRSDTLPPQPSKEVTAMVSPQEVARVLDHSKHVLVLDLRVYPQYTASRIQGALNLCIPTTLLKRPAFTVQKLADTFANGEDKAKFDKWHNAQYIIVYDAASSLAKEAITSFHVLKKFMSEGWKGTGLVVKGGFAGFYKLAPRHVDRSNKSAAATDIDQATSSSSSIPPKLPVAGGCQMPATKNAANPFFSNIRQNMDLLDGVGQMPIKRPQGMQASEEKKLPAWLRRAVSTSNEGKEVSNKFLRIERSEQQRMQQALSGSVSYGTPGPKKQADVQVAGIEKGSKNRYNNIFPFEHSRVRLQNVPLHGCDYVNASYIQAKYSERKYIATQAPIPQTFEDFWRVIWEQGVRVVVMLTAESEGGQVKSHAYWKSGVYGNVQIKLTREQKVTLTSRSSETSSSSQRRPGVGRRLTTTGATPKVEKQFNFEPTQVKVGMPKIDEEPAVTVRYFAIAHSSSHKPREVVQIQYTQWPDFGAPASHTAILSLISLVD